MAVDLERFKKAFLGKVSNPIYKVNHAALLAELKYIEGVIKSLTNQDAAKAHAVNAAALHKQLKAVEKLAESKPTAAVKDLRVVADATKQLRKAVQVDADSQYEQVKASVLKGDKPNKADFAALAKMPAASRKGSRLDELIAIMPDRLPQQTFIAAIEARFGQDVRVYEQELFKTNKDGTQGAKLPENKWTKVDPKTPDKSLKRIYLMLAKVPESHSSAKQNKSLKKIVHLTKEDSGGYYSYAQDGVYMTCSRNFGVGLQNQTEEIATGLTTNGTQMFADQRDPNCVPQNTDVETSYFDWATLHEVGHSVDDKYGFMEKYKKGPDYGSWQIHKGAAKEIAALAAQKFKCDAKYIERMLKGDAIDDKDVPAALKGSPAAQARRDQVDQWCYDVIGDAWWDGAKSKRIAVAMGDGRVYQRAYDWEWNSYEYAARSKGIHGYQFRAQYEWFAELYAAYYSGKLKPAHPAVKWLRELEAPKKK